MARVIKLTLIVGKKITSNIWFVFVVFFLLKLQGFYTRSDCVEIEQMTQNEMFKLFA